MQKNQRKGGCMKKSMNFLEFTQKFSSEEICIQTLEHVRWGGKVVSPFDPTSKVYKCKNHKYKCKNTNRYFTVRTGTYFANSNLSFMKAFITNWTPLKKGGVQLVINA